MTPGDLSGGREGQPASRRQFLRLDALLVAALVAWRLLAVANYQPSSAAAVAASQGVGSTLLGTVIPLLPLALPWLAVAAALWGLVQVYLLYRVSGAFVAAANGVGLAAASGFVTPSDRRSLPSRLWHGVTTFLPVWFLIIATIASLVIAAVAAMLHKRLEFSLGGEKAIIAAICVLVISYALGGSQWSYPKPLDLARRVWLPPEIVQLKDQPPIIGYVLETRDGWVSVLREDDRTVARLKTDAISGRTICVVDQPQLLPQWRSREIRPSPLKSCPSPHNA